MDVEWQIIPDSDIPGEFPSSLVGCPVPSRHLPFLAFLSLVRVVDGEDWNRPGKDIPVLHLKVRNAAKD